MKVSGQFHAHAITTWRRHEDNTVAWLLGNATNNLRVLDLILDLLDIRHAELQLITTPLILL
jgi:hypothetical protein